MATFSIFYSWQSDLPNRTNRVLIHGALKLATKGINKDASIEEPVRIDSDTKGVPGAPDIVSSIFEKIDAADAFVADVSLISTAEGLPPTPNPNVLIELGYALRSLGWDRLILVINTAFGSVERLPFDLSKRRAMPYEFPDKAEIKPAEARNPLARDLEGALRMIISRGKMIRNSTSLQKEHWLPELNALRDMLKEGLVAARRPRPPFYKRGEIGLVEDMRFADAVDTLTIPDDILKNLVAKFLTDAQAISSLWFTCAEEERTRSNIYGPSGDHIERLFFAKGAQALIEEFEKTFHAVNNRINEILS